MTFVREALFVLTVCSCVAQNSAPFVAIQGLSGEARVFGMARMLDALSPKERAIAIESLRSELGRMGFLHPLQLTTNVVADQREGYFVNASQRATTSLDLLILLFDEYLTKEAFLAADFLKQAVREGGGATSCRAVAAPDLTRLRAPMAKALSHPSAYQAKRKDYWDGASILSNCHSLSCLNVFLLALSDIVSSVPPEYSKSLGEAAVARLTQIQLSERDLYLQQADTQKFQARMSFLQSLGLRESYLQALFQLGTTTLSRERCRDLWADERELTDLKIPKYLDSFFRLSGATLREDDALLVSIRKAPMHARNRVNYFWGGPDGERIIDGLKKFSWAFRDGGEEKLLGDVEQRATLMNFLDQLDEFAKESRWNVEESVMIRSLGISRIMPLVSNDAALVVWLLDKMDSLYNEVRGTRKLEAVLLSDALASVDLLKQKKEQYREIVARVSGKLRTPEMAYVLRSSI